MDEFGVLGRGVEDGPQRASGQGAQHLVALVEDPAEHRLRAVEGACHTRVLRALPGEQEHDLRAGAGPHVALAAAGGLSAFGALGQPLPHLGGGGGRHGQPVGEVGPAGGGGEADVAEFGVGRCGEPVAVLPGKGGERCGVLRGQGQQVCGALRDGDVGIGFCGGLLDDQMRVGSAGAERADTGDPGRGSARPRSALGRDLDGEVLDAYFRVDFGQVQVRGYAFVLEGQDDLDQPGDTGGRFQVADVGLDRPHQQRTRLAALAEYGVQGAQLQRVAERRAGAMRLDVADLGRFDGSRLQGLADHRLLRGGVRDGDAAAASVLIDGGAPDHGEDPVPGRAGVGQPLQYDDAAALTAYVTVRARVECLAPAVRREHVRFGGDDEPLRCQQHVHAAGQGQVGLPRAQALARQMHADQGGGTGSVDGQAGAVQAEPVRQPAGRECGGVPSEAVGGQVGRVDLLHLRLQIVVRGDPEVDAGVGALESFRRLSRVFEGLPAHLQQQALLRVEGGRLAGGDTEEPGVEPVDVVQKSAAAGGHLAGCVRVGVVEAVDVPACGRDLTDAVPAAVQELPERLRAVGAARHAAGHTDDGDGLRSGVLHRVEFGAQPADLLQALDKD
ncbi:hypothetical protein LUX34_00055 [Streptomyces werraensis]|nr:hypothetical protein [Streptomyces werraensis]